MQLLYLCTACNKYVVLHSGEMSRINFARMPQAVLEASNHSCKKKDGK